MGIPGSANLLLLATAAPTGYNIERSLRFNSADSAYLSRTPASAGNRKTWTWAGWVKRSGTGTFQELFGAGSNNLDFSFNSDNLTLYEYNGSTTLWQRTTAAVYRDFSSWYHIVLAVDTTQATAANRMRLYVNGNEVTVFSVSTNPTQNSDTYVNSTIAHYIGRQSINNRYLDAYLADIHFIDGQALAPTSFGEFDVNNVWQPKAYTGSYGTNGFQLKFADNSNNTATTLGKDTSGNNNNWTPTNLDVTSYNVPAYSASNTTTIANAFDGNLSTFWAAGSFQPDTTLTFTQAVTGTTFRLYISTGSQSGLFTINGTVPSTRPSGAARWYDYSSHINGSLSSITLGPAGTESLAAIEVNGFILRPVTTDSLVDTPTSYGADTGAGGQVRSNYATLNPLVNVNSSTLTNGNLDITCASAVGQWRTQKGGWGFYGGKFYFEATLNAGGSAGNSGVGIGRITLPHSGNVYPGQSVGSYAYTSDGGKIDSGSATYPWATWTAKDVIGVATDLTAGTVAFYKNGTLQGSMTGLDTTLTYEVLVGSASSTASQYSLNFGQRPFAYTAPSGFKALCTANLPTPTIANGATAMDVLTWTGTDSGTTRSFTGLNFSPDLIWTKNRSKAYEHLLYDSVRGTGTASLATNTTAAEGGGLPGSYGYLSAFGSQGFTFTRGSFGSGADPDGYAYYDELNAAYVAWTWDAGSSTVTNTSGSISSQVRANASAGFSIVQWTTTGTWPRTVGHGLGVEPFLIIDKCSNNIGNWTVYHKSLGNAAYLQLNTTAAQTTGASIWNSTTPSSTVFSINDSTYWGSSGFTHISYCFAPVAGFSAFGSYTGNGSTDGPFVFCNFHPRWIMFKRTDAWHWFIFDSSRLGYNAQNPFLAANLTVSEDSNDTYVDLLSNGFKLRSINQAVNNNGSTFIYAAFAEHPFSASRAR